MRHVQTMVAHLADRIIVPSNYLKKIVGLWNINEEKIVVVYNAFEPVLTNETKEDTRRDLNMVRPTILSVGRIVPWKGFDTLIEIMPEIQKEIPEAQLVVIGEGGQKKELEELVQKKNLGDSVVFTGILEHKKTLMHIKASDVFVLNTQYEGFSHLLLEVMSLGTPIVTTSVGGNVELIKHEKNGLLVNHDDKKALIAAVLQTLSDHVGTEKMVGNASENILDYSTDRMIQATIRVLSLSNKRNNARH